MVALIFRASPNNGGTIAHFMAREGARIAANDIVPEVAEETAECLRSRGYDALDVEGDASQKEQAEDIVSSAGHYGEAGNSGYSAAKAGLLNFSRAAAMDLAHQGIRVNTITPFF